MVDVSQVDTYAGYTPGSHGADEVAKAKLMYEDILFPKLHSHQKVLLVPGVFACTNFTYFPLALQDQNVADKMKAYFAWAQSEPRIAGFNPWHFNNRSKPQAHGACDMELGAVALPKTMATLKDIGQHFHPL